MLNKSLVALVLLVVISCAYGCSGGSMPAMQPDLRDSEPDAGSGAEHMLWGVWSISFDQVANAVKVEPLRNLQPHFNITAQLLPPNCDDCLAIKVNSFNLLTRILEADVTLRNPYKIDGYDVRGILYTNDHGHELTNPDDWTGLWDAPGGNIINPFRAFAKTAPNRLFPCDGEYVENYRVYIPKPPEWAKITFAVDASWPGHCKEPYEITNFSQEPIYDTIGSTGSISIDVRDWQDDVSQVALIAPEITGEAASYFTHQTGDTWTLDLTNNVGAAAGDYNVRVIANSSDSGALAAYDYVTVTITTQMFPVVYGIYPNSAQPDSYIQDVVVSGTGFQGPDAQVKLKKSGAPDIVAENVNVEWDASISCDLTIPLDAEPGLYDVEVTNDNGMSGVGTDLFEVLAPKVTGIDPNSAELGAYLNGVMVFGSGFQGPDALVKLKMQGQPDIEASNVFVPAPSSITCDIHIPPDAATGLYDVEVTNDNDLSGVGIELFLVHEEQPFNPYDITPPYFSFSPLDVCVDGNYAYVVCGTDGLHIFDISDPDHPEWVSWVATPGYAYARGVAVLGGYAYVADDMGGLIVINVSTPGSPYIVNSVSMQGSAMGVAVSGGYAYVAAYIAGMHVVDISVPESAHVVKSVSQLGWWAHDVAVSGDYAYVANSEGLQIVDISVPESASIVKSVETPGNGYGVAVSGAYAYVAAYDAGLQIIDISTPGSASIINSVDTPGYAIRAAASNGYAYIADSDAGLQVIDISPPGSASIVKTVQTQGYVQGVAVSGNYAYAADSEIGLLVVDITAPESAYIIGTFGMAMHASAVVLSDDLAYVACDGGLQIFEISTPESAFILQTVAAPSAGRGVAVLDDYAYLADDESGLQVIDISSPESAFIAKTVDTPGTAVGVAVSNGYAYVADYSAGLQVIDIDPLMSASIVKTVAMPGWWTGDGVAVSDGYAYVADYDAGLQIVDISIPESAHIVKAVGVTGYAQGVVISGQYAYVGSIDTGGLHIIDISVPESAYVLNTVSMLGLQDGDVAVSGGYAYVTSGNMGFCIVDISPPESAYFILLVPTPEWASGIAVSDNYAYVADGAGLRIFILWW